MTTTVTSQATGAGAVGPSAFAIDPPADVVRYDPGDPRRIALRGVEPPSAHHGARRG